MIDPIELDLITAERLTIHAQRAYQQGDYGTARIDLEKALAIYRSLNLADKVFAHGFELIIVLLQLNEFAIAEPLLADHIQTTLDEAQPTALSRPLLLAAFLFYCQGRYATSIVCLGLIPSSESQPLGYFELWTELAGKLQTILDAETFAYWLTEGKKLEAETILRHLLVRLTTQKENPT